MKSMVKQRLWLKLMVLTVTLSINDSEGIDLIVSVNCFSLTMKSMVKQRLSLNLMVLTVTLSIKDSGGID